jgi:group I intron endonuclease
MARKAKDYSNGKVYVIRNTVNDKVYVGSTTQPLCKRMVEHRIDSKTKTGKIYQKMREIGIEKFYIELLELCPCQTQEQLNQREGELIRQHNSMVDGYNSEIAGRVKNEYYQDNKDKIAEYQQANKDKIAEYQCEYKQANKDKIAEYQCEYRKDNKDKIAEYQQANKDKISKQKREYRQANKDKIAEYYQANKDKIAEYKREYQQANKDKIAEQKRAYYLKNKK